MSFYGRFFKPEEKLTFRKVLDRVGVFTAVECKAYIESNRQALYHLHSIQQDDGSVKFDLEENKKIERQTSNMKETIKNGNGIDKDYCKYLLECEKERNK